jgi:hypothetical protein
MRVVGSHIGFSDEVNEGCPVRTHLVGVDELEPEPDQPSQHHGVPLIREVGQYGELLVPLRDEPGSELVERLEARIEEVRTEEPDDPLMGIVGMWVDPA